MIRALRNAPTITPIRISRSRETPLLRRARRNTADAASAAPKNGHSGRGRKEAPGSRSLAVIAPTAAPPETPRMYGSASGLRRRAWNATPEEERAPPTSAPRRALGSRSVRTTRAAVSPAGPPPRECPKRLPEGHRHGARQQGEDYRAREGGGQEREHERHAFHRVAPFPPPEGPAWRSLPAEGTSATPPTPSPTPG